MYSGITKEQLKDIVLMNFYHFILKDKENSTILLTLMSLIKDAVFANTKRRFMKYLKILESDMIRSSSKDIKM